MSAVQVTGGLRQLREGGPVTFPDRHVTFCDCDALVQLAEFDTAYPDQTGPLLK